ncbi:Imm42 family immunity protein [Pseudomonas sp. YH-1]|uniref:Imm42 family immunity protein n=1 Tax=Pseudomonas sp. YH-1 TaxID=3384787 RepID=UPI003F80A258
MIVGDPFSFALQFDVVNSWNLPGSSWKNGVFSLYISGEGVFSAIDVVELGSIFCFYSNALVEDLPINDLKIDSAGLYKSASEYFWGDGVELVDGLFDMTPTVMSDGELFLYFVKTSVGDRLVWSASGEAVKEVYLEAGTVLNVIKELRSCNL